MATLVLGIAGAALGSAFGGVGAILGRAAGAIAGYVIDGALFGSTRKVEGPRLSDLQVQASTEGAVIPRLYGRTRLAGQIIWATDFEEEVSTESGGKGGPRVSVTEYSYFANFAVALCEGPVARIGRIWADGKLLDQAAFTFRLHRGGEEQLADSLILARQGGEAPAYRGTAYVVFEHMPLEDFGNRLPQLSFEVLRPVGGIEAHLRAMCIIPGSTEFGYDPLAVSRVTGFGGSAAENAHVLRDGSDWSVSLDELQALCPALEWVTLVVAWFGDDLRAGACTLRPKVDDPAKALRGASWGVAGLTRATAQQVTLSGGRPAYGGSPSDATVMRAIADLKARGLKVVLAPFVLMDVPAGNTLPNPASGGTGQPPYPWRGEITCMPAPGRPGSPDKTPAAGSEVTAFLGSALPGHFGGLGGVTYSGPAEWRYRRMVLHYAKLATLAGGVDGFLIGSELRGLSTLRSGPSTYPMVAGLQTLAADVRGMLGAGPKISYAADWSEYFGHQPADGTGDVFFHLDPLWAHSAVDFVGIDLYHPLSDWRDGADHSDAEAGRTASDPDYLLGNVRGGEGFDWFYASPADRVAQIRTPITDGAGKPWLFRFKDIEAWWANPHHNRPGGVEAAGATAWVPRAKPIWLTELGCPAVDKGPNQPNVFFDPKSSSSALPYFSSGARDDLAQRRYIEAYQRFFDPGHPDFAGSNPLSPLYGGRMVDPAHLHVWAWDARPYPHFPQRSDLWSDGANWERGHWLNGRLGTASVAALIEAVLADHGFGAYALSDVEGMAEGYVVGEVLSARATLEPLLQAFRVDAADAGERLLFRGRNRPADAALEAEQLVERAGEPLTKRSRAQETEIASELILRVIDPVNDYRLSAAASRRLAGQSRRTTTLELSAVLPLEAAERLTDQLLRDAWTGRERVELRLPPSAGAVEAGDILMLQAGVAGAQQAEAMLAGRIEDGESRAVEARRVDNRLQAAPPRPARERMPPVVSTFGPPEVLVVDFAPPDGREAHAPRLAVFADPWPGRVAIYSGGAGGGFSLAGTLTRRATAGRLTAVLAPGPLGIWDRHNHIELRLHGGALSGLPDLDVYAGGNAAAVRTGSGGWEVLQFAEAELTGPGEYRLSRLLRGQCGTEAAMEAGAAIDADFVLLDGAVQPLPVRPEAVGVPVQYRIGPARDDHAAPSFVELSIIAGGVGLKPFAPVHPRARRDASGDIVASWIRRTRFGGDAWELAEVPLNEEREAYRVEILAGAVLRRSVEVVSPQYRYALGEQTADFGAPATDFTLRVAQLSATAGPGQALEETLHA
jgi:hypothetical protein